MQDNVSLSTGSCSVHVYTSHRQYYSSLHSHVHFGNFVFEQGWCKMMHESAFENVDILILFHESNGDLHSA